MRIGKRFILLLCLAALALGAQETRLAGPVSGVLFDPEMRALRPIMGVLGASYLGDAVVGDLEFASVAPNGKLAIAVQGDRVLALRGLDGEAIETAVIEAAAATRAAWAADSSAVALYVGAGTVEVWCDLATTPRRAYSAEIGEVTGLAVSASGRHVAAASPTGAVLLAGEGAAVRAILQLERPAALAFAAGGLYVADPARSEVLVLGNYAEGGDARLFANASRGIQDPAALAISPDQRMLFVASRSGKSLALFDLASAEMIAAADLDFEPTRLERFSGSLYALTGIGADTPLQVLDGARAPAVYFVPAQPASEMED